MITIEKLQEIHDKHRIFKDKKTGSFDIVLENLNWLKSFLCTKCQISIKSTWIVKNAKFYGESIIYLNSVATVEKFNKNLKKNSLNVFKNNPNNKKFN